MEQAQPKSELGSLALWSVAPDRIVGLWSLVAEDVSRVVRRPGVRELPMQIRQELIEGKAHLFLILRPTQPSEAPEYRGCVMTRLLFGRDGSRVLEVALAAGIGVFDQVSSLLAELELFARAEGCCAIEFVGRKGWSRALPADYHEIGRVFMKEL